MRLLIRRGSAVVGAAVLLLGLAACGDDEPATNGSVELRFGWWGNADRAAATQKVIEAFQAANPNIKIKGETTDFNAYFDKLATETAAGSAPDVITLGGAYPREYGDRGALLDLARVKNELKTDKLGEAALSNGNFGDKQFGVPSGVNAISLVVNPSLIQAAGVTLPDTETWSWDDFGRVTRDLAAKLPAGRYALSDPTRTDMLDVWSRQKGEGLYTKDGKVGLGEGTLADWFTMATGFRDAKVTPPAATVAELQTQPAPEQTLMGRGLAAMQFDWTNQVTALSKASGQDLQLHRIPGENARPGQWLQASQIYSINAKSKHPKESAKFVHFLVNSVDAGKIILTDRGIPSNTDVRDAILGSLTPAQSVSVSYIDKLAPKSGPPLVIGPTGSTDTPGILDRLTVELLFNRKTPQQAAKDFIAQVKTAIKQ